MPSHCYLPDNAQVFTADKVLYLACSLIESGLKVAEIVLQVTRVFSKY